MKRILFGSAIVVAALAVWILMGRGGGETQAYRLVEIERGDVESAVSSTGTLQATTTVQVGTQVSGQLAEIYADFNDRVAAGQLIARIDPTLLQQEVRAAEAAVERSQAELDQAERELGRMRQLFERQVATDSEHSTAQYQHAIARASLKTARVNLEKARRNLSYSEILAPVDGVVVERNVDVGQTVAASLSAPQLFLIAGDLSALEILAAVDESDIGQIHAGQEVRFTVQAYPDAVFPGTVHQVRLQSTMQENVVSYTVVVGVANPDGRLLPGMTATVDFIVAHEREILKVANAALRFRPTPEMRAALGARRDGASNRSRDPAARADSASRGQRPDGARRNRTMLWFVGEDGKVNATPVVAGISDGQYTVIRGRSIEAGMSVIAGVMSSSASSSTNPFQGPQQQGGRRPSRPGM